MIEITDVQIVFPYTDDPKNKKLKCFANIVFNKVFIVRNLRVIEGGKGFFVVMPNFKKKDGSFQDTAHPLTNEFRQLIDSKVLEAYEKALQQHRGVQT